MSVAAAAAALQKAEQAARVAKAEEADARTALDAAPVSCGWRRVVGLVGPREAYYITTARRCRWRRRWPTRAFDVVV